MSAVRRRLSRLVINDQASSDAEDRHEANEVPPPPPYTLRDHCRYLGLKTEYTDRKSYWYCDWTSHFVPTLGTAKLENVVKEYCQPFSNLAELQDTHVGISALNSHTEDPLAVRTLSIRLRPDASHYKILQAVHQAFTNLHRSEYHIVASTTQTFQAIGAHGSVPYFVSASVGIHSKALERRLWIRFYHMESVALVMAGEDDTPSSRPIRNFLERLETSHHPEHNEGGSRHKMAPLRNELTPLNTRLAEACVLVQFVFDGNLEPSFACPEQTQQETSEFFQTTFTPSTSALEESKALPRHRNASKIFPSLASDDYPILQESWPLLDRIWSELQLQKCTWDTLVVETSRFGMPPCQATLDKDFCFALSEISQHAMLLDLQYQVAEAESILHETLGQYHALQVLLRDVLKKYRVPLPEGVPSTNKNLDIGQTPIKFSKRKLADFPWHDSVKKALDRVSREVAQACLVAHDPSKSLQTAQDAVEHVYQAFGAKDDIDQQHFLKQRNRQAMIRVAQEQAICKRLLEQLILAPTNWPKLPKLTSTVERWYEISLQSHTSNTRRNPVPIVEFQTKLGQGCVTATQIMLLGGILSTSVQVYDIIDVDLKATPQHPLTKLSIFQNGKRIGGFNPVDTRHQLLVQTVQTLKQLQEA